MLNHYLPRIARANYVCVTSMQSAMAAGGKAKSVLQAVGRVEKAFNCVPEPRGCTPKSAFPAAFGQSIAPENFDFEYSNLLWLQVTAGLGLAHTSLPHKRQKQR